MKKIKYILYSAIVTLFLGGCDVQEDSQDVEPVIGTDGYPTASFTFSGGALSSKEEDESIYTFDVELDKPMKYNVDFNFKQTGGTATLHEDYEVVKATVNAFETTGQMTVTILNDTKIEDIETLELTVIPGPAVADANILRPDTQYPSLALEIQPSFGYDLTIAMEWDADNGSENGPTDLADLILLVTDAVTPYTNVVTGADGGSFEELTLAADTADGDYFIVVDVYAADDSDFNIDVDLTFNQPGVIDEAINFPKALTSRLSCSEYVVLAKVTKSGDDWSIASEDATLTSDGTPDTSMAAPFIGTATVVQDDWADYAIGDSVEIEAGASANEFWIRNYTNPVDGFNTDTAYMIVTIDDVCGNVTVMSNEDYQYGCPTGVVTGSGKLDLATKTIDITNTFALGEACGGDYAGQQFILQLP